ncbi:maleylpyruvate isomerase family mycothiol-dependent enzyme [Actinophytocola sp.]|uniref:maleylpyruvate isomerase family mycothiol-dependent enzyme n=1 Tax=Actinophytocola sp. TaxID=1872138 RepID=UPI002D7F0CF9|nr:maleylpyruvate isomerase family mycothiol-dependent enzyme [Actinophytocola sp.]HET9140999.1 maleylpyruvate isomerase family mycothiol-dependent enzyme [Actinophytocola sp.]
MTPPRTLRSTVLTAALHRRPAGYPDPEALPAEAIPYAAEVRKLDTLLSGVTGSQWHTRTVTGWTARELVDHLSGHDAVLAGALGVDPRPAAPASPQGSHRAWRERAFALLRHAAFTPLTGRVEVFGMPMPVGNAYLGRAFETWIHADDLRLATGRPVRPPSPRHLLPLADLHIRSLPAALKLSGRTRPGRTARIVLTGVLTADWLIALSRDPAGSTEPSVTLTADALDFCYLAANRRTPDAVPLTITGDRALAADLLAVMTFFSDE